MEDHGIAMMADAAEGLVATERNLEEVLSDPALLQRVHYLLAALIEKIVLAPDVASATRLGMELQGDLVRPPRTQNAPLRSCGWGKVDTPAAERCQSGRSGRSRKPLSLCGLPGFESLSLRHALYSNI
jgi:hypothetical protein